MVQGRPGWFQAPSCMAASTCLKYIAAPAKLCSDDLLLVCGRDELLLSKVLPAPAHTRDMLTMDTRGLRPDMQAGLLTTNKDWIQAPLTVSHGSLCVPVGSLRTDLFALSQSSCASLLFQKSLWSAMVLDGDAAMAKKRQFITPVTCRCQSLSAGTQHQSCSECRMPSEEQGSQPSLQDFPSCTGPSAFPPADASHWLSLPVVHCYISGFQAALVGDVACNLHLLLHAAWWHPCQ